MTENSKSNRQSLSDISHLFLAEQREKQPGERPVRKPPASNTRTSSMSIDITPREFGAVGKASPAGLELSVDDHAAAALKEDDDSPRLNLSVVVAHHLGASALPRVRDYARHIAAGGERVGLIEIGDDGLRLTCFEDASASDDSAGGSAEETQAEVEPVDGARIAEALEELSWDVQRWLFFLPGATRSADGRNLLGQLQRWTLLATADDEGMVNAYRALKGMSGIGSPALSLAVAGADDGAAAEIIHRKLAGASRQFLGRAIELEGAVRETQGISAHGVLWCRAGGGTHDHWTAVAEWATKSVSGEAVDQADEIEIPELPEPSQPQRPVAEEIAPPEEQIVEEPQPMEPVAIPIFAHIPAAEALPSAAEALPSGKVNMDTTDSDISDVLDLPAGATAAGILAAVMSEQTEWVACPVKPPVIGPGADDARTVAVDRQGRLALLAVAGGGLAELRTISRGYSWLIENRELVRMAVGQMKIDAAALPRLVLFLDEAGVSGEQLAAIFGGGNVTVRTYRRLRWGQKTGLLLKAA